MARRLYLCPRSPHIGRGCRILPVPDVFQVPMTTTTPSLRAPRAAPGLAPGFTRRLARTGWVALGVVIVLAGTLIGALPGPGGIPIVALGLVLILKHSRTARRLFVRAQ